MYSVVILQGFVINGIYMYILGCSDLDLFVKMEDTKAEMDAKFEFKTYLKKIFFLSE
jgi:hypothetical protein